MGARDRLIDIGQINAELAAENEALADLIRPAIAAGCTDLLAVAQLKATQAVHERLGDIFRLLAVKP
jgi:hypothetical protein